MDKIYKILFLNFLLTFLFSGVIAQTITIGNGMYVYTTFNLAGPMHTYDFGTTAYNRHAYIYPSSTLGGLEHGAVIQSISFNRYGNTNNSIIDTPHFKIYLSNTDTAFFPTGSLIWSSVADSSNLVYEGNPALIIGNSGGFKEFELNVTPFIFDTSRGQHLQLMVEYYQPAAQSDNIAWLIDDQTSVSAYSSNQVKYAIGSGTPSQFLSGNTNFRPQIRLHAYLDYDAGVDEIYSLGKIPLNFGSPHTVSASITNNGEYGLTNLEVYLEISGANTFRDTLIINSISPEESMTINFAQFTPQNIGENTITVSLPPDDFNANNSKSISQKVNYHTYNYCSTDQPNGAVGFDNGSGFILSKYNVSGSRKVEGVNLFIANNPATVNQSIYAVVLDTNGDIIGRSQSFTPSTSDLNAYRTFRITNPPTVTNTHFYVGIAQPADTQSGYFPLAYQFERPVRNNSYYIVPENLNGGVQPVMHTGIGRWMIEALLRYTDVSVTNILSPLDNDCGNANQYLEAEISNIGSVLQGNIEVTAIVSNGQTDTFSTVHSATLQPGAKTTILLGPFNTAQGGNYQFKVYTSLSTDENRSNDTLIVSRILTTAPVPPVAINDTLCHEGFATLKVTSLYPEIFWYNSPVGGFLLQTGDTWMTPFISENYTVYVENMDPQTGCRSERTPVTAVVHPLPEVKLIRDTVFEASFNDGTPDNPDSTCVGNRIIYKFVPPDSLTNSSYGTDWIITDFEFQTNNGYEPLNFQYFPPTLNNSGRLIFETDTTDSDSLYQISFHVFNFITNCENIFSRFIVVGEGDKPDAAFIVNDACPGETIEFINQSTIDNGGLTFLWDFDDGNNSTLESPQHIFNSPGNYMVRLLAFSDTRCPDQAVANVHIFDVPDLEFETNFACEFNDATLINKSTMNDSSQVDFEWIFHDGTTSELENPMKNFGEQGFYFVKLKATTILGCKDSLQKMIEIQAYPQADFIVDNVCFNLPAIFENKSTGSIIEHKWDFGNGNSTSVFEPVYLYPSEGTYMVELKVSTSNNCMDSISKLITVFDLPESQFNLNKIDEEIHFLPFNENLSFYFWEFGDGNSSQLVKPVHKYLESGSYNTSLYVLDENDCEHQSVKMVDVELTSLDEVTYNQTKMKVYPNPAQNQWFVSFSLNSVSKADLVLYDIFGREILVYNSNELLKPGEHLISMETNGIKLPASTYILKLTTNEGAFLKRLIIE